MRPTILPHRLDRVWSLARRRPELALFTALLFLLNAPLLAGVFPSAWVFHPEAIRSGEWWRLVTHPFVHATWYHLLLDGVAFLALYESLIEPNRLRRLTYVLAGGVGSLLAAWVSYAGVSVGGLCGLSGMAHGLMAVSALEALKHGEPGSAERRAGWISLVVVVAKAVFEAISGRMLFTFLHFGMMGDPVAVSHAGGVLGSLAAMALLGVMDRTLHRTSSPSMSLIRP